MEPLLQDRMIYLVDSIRYFYQRGWAPATSTNYSFRLAGDNHIYITASGLDKSRIRPSDLMKADQKGRPIDDTRKPSAETGLHTLIYRLRPDMHAVLHTHSVYATVLSMIFQKDRVLEIKGLEVQKGMAGLSSHQQSLRIPIFRNDQDIDALAERIERRDRTGRMSMQAFLLAGHGLYTWGRSLEEARRHVEAIEFLLECLYKIHTFPNASD